MSDSETGDVYEALRARLKAELREELMAELRRAPGWRYVRVTDGELMGYGVLDPVADGLTATVTTTPPFVMPPLFYDSEMDSWYACCLKGYGSRREAAAAYQAMAEATAE